ncbi:MAG: hypothetical protein KDB88_01900 [Flavobacteriales bacterium]|nr:hypothetical protein [Flavobacteriales bacterium]
MESGDPDLMKQFHAFAGAVAFVVAPLAMVVKKGGRWHRRWGRAFFYAMTVVCGTAVYLGIREENVLMALVALFSFHMAASGYRALYLKKLHKGLKPAKWDLVIQGAAAVVNGGLLIWGIAHLMLGQATNSAMIFTAFGLVGGFMVFLQVRKFYSPRQDKQEWLYAHMIGFLGSYIATVSAFSAVNLDMLRPVWLQWLWPTLVGSPLIAWWVRYMKAKVGDGSRSRIVARARLK